MTQNAYSIKDDSTEFQDALDMVGVTKKQANPPTQDVVDTKLMWDEKEKEKHKHDGKTLDQLKEAEDEIAENVCVQFDICIFNVSSNVDIICLTQ